MNARCVPSGDQTGSRAVPRARINCAARPPFSGIDQIWLFTTHATVASSGEITAPWPSPSLRGAPAKEAIQISCCTPEGLLRGLGNSACALGSPPRVKTTAVPSCFHAIPPSSCPSSAANFVSGAARKSGECAAHTLRTPCALRTQATASPFGEATRSLGKDALSTCSIVNGGAASRGSASRKPVVILTMNRF